MICDGTSTKSRGKPASVGYGTLPRNPASAWPNSWNSVFTSSSVSSAGSSPDGRVKLQTLVTIGRTTLPLRT